MSPARLLPLPFLALLGFALVRAPGAQEVRVLDARMHHLGDDLTPEWDEAPPEPEGGGLSLRFEARALAGESTLELRQGRVDDAWHIEINGTRVATLARRQPVERHYYAVPAGVLRDGENTFELVGDRPSDDISFGEVKLHERSFREVLDLRPVVVRVRDAASGTPSPARVTVLDAAGAFAPLYFAERLHTAVREGLCYSADGEARFELPPGRYEVFATRGTEWSLGRAPLVVEAPSHELDLELAREVDTRGFVACDTHIHTLTFSGHGDASVEERLVTLAGEGVELAVSTDHNHNTDYRPYQERMGLSPWFTPIVGNEVTTPVGHFNGFPLDPRDAIPPHELHDVATIVAGIRARGAQVVILNHPRWPDHEQGPFGVYALDTFTGASGMEHPYDAMELINSQTEEPEPLSLFRDWFALLDRGERVWGVASSDSHTVAGVVGMGRTYVESSSDDPAALDVDQCCRNIASGRTSVSLGIFADVEVDGRGPGELVTLVGQGELSIALRVAAPAWVRPRRATVFVNGRPAVEVDVPAEAGRPTDVRLDLRAPVPAHDAWVACVVTGDGVGGPWWPQLNDYTLAATNPVFLDVDADGAYAAPRETAQRLLDATDSDPDALERLLARCDEAVALQALELAREAWRLRADQRLRRAAGPAAERMQRVRAWLERLPQR